MTNIKSQLTTNSDNDSTYTRYKNDPHLPQAKLAIYQKGIFYSGVKIFNNIPLDIKNKKCSRYRPGCGPEGG